MAQVTATIGTAHYATHIKTDNHDWVADEPISEGGTDLGPDPFEHLKGGLACCMAITLRMYIDRKGWPVSGIFVSVDMLDVDPEHPHKGNTFIAQVQVTGTLDAEQLTRITKIAQSCPVHKILSRGNHIETNLVLKAE